MILATVGTSAGFDSLMQKLDELAAGRFRGQEFVAQIATGRYEPQHMTWFRYSERIPELFRQAEVIVGHGGTGTTIEALKLGKPLVGLANRVLADDHQHEFLVECARRGLLIFCESLDHLGDCIARALARPPMIVDTARFGRRLVATMEADFARCAPAGRSDQRPGARLPT